MYFLFKQLPIGSQKTNSLVDIFEQTYRFEGWASLTQRVTYILSRGTVFLEKFATFQAQFNSQARQLKSS